MTAEDHRPTHSRTWVATFVLLGAVLALAPPRAPADMFTFDGGTGRSGTADFVLTDGTTLEITLRNTSSAPPEGAGGILTSVAFDLPGATTITGASAKIDSGSHSVNFNIGPMSVFVGEGADVSGEWGYGNGGATGFGDLLNYISTNTAGTTPMGGENLDGPAGLSGPQGGLVSPAWTPGGQGGIEDKAIFTLFLSDSVTNLGFLTEGGVLIEFGSDELFLTDLPELPEPPGPPPGPPGSDQVPEPATCLIFGAGCLLLASRRRRRRA